MSGAVSGSVSVVLSSPPDPHRCPHPEGCLCSSVGEFLMQGMREGEEKRTGLPRGVLTGKKICGRGGNTWRAKARQSSSSSLSSSDRRALKAPPTTWVMGGGARGDQSGREASLWEGWLMGRGIVRGRAWESRETGKVGGSGRGEVKFGKGERAVGVCPSDPPSEL